MSVERDFAALLRRQIAGERGTPDGIEFTGGTPSQGALAAATAYAYGLLSNAVQRNAGRRKALDFFRTQNLIGHMTHISESEFGTASHFAWWQAAVAGIWLMAERFEDPGMLNAARTWWIHELTVENLCATPGGRVVIPGARSPVGGVDADQTKQRDAGRMILLGGDPHLPKRLVALEDTGLWILRRIPRGELDHVAQAPPELPNPMDTLHVLRNDRGHVAWFDEFHGLRPAYWAWADYATGEERYGANPSWPRDFKSEKRPAGLPVPELPGGNQGASLVTAQGLLGEEEEEEG